VYKIRILSIGKTKEAWLENALQEYVKRLQGTVSIEFEWLRNEDQLLLFAKKEPLLICLDEKGVLMTSEQFAGFLKKNLEQGGARLAIVIGGAEGLPSPLKAHHALVSLSPMTFTHQLTRLVLLEQIYRAMEINKGSRYHRK
jgi:23S rRNA (pseudouridine1915-N3)-methyltransferase